MMMRPPQQQQQRRPPPALSILAGSNCWRPFPASEMVQKNKTTTKAQAHHKTNRRRRRRRRTNNRIVKSRRCCKNSSRCLWLPLLPPRPQRLPRPPPPCRCRHRHRRPLNVYEPCPMPAGSRWFNSKHTRPSGLRCLRSPLWRWRFSRRWRSCHYCCYGVLNDHRRHQPRGRK